MIIALWIVNGLLALVFLAAGGTKLLRPKPALAAIGMGFVDDYSLRAVKLIGAAEVLGALGLVLPLATGVAPILAPIAAAALAVLMIGAVATHVRRKETSTSSLVLGVLTVVSAILGAIVVLS